MGDAAIACLLTGWDATAPAGLLAIGRAGGMTFAQDEESSVVFGMPRAAIELEAATYVLDPGRDRTRVRGVSVEPRGLDAR